VDVQTQARIEVVGHAGNGNASLVVRLGHRPQLTSPTNLSVSRLAARVNQA
jgi:hypothetical protein